MKVLYFQYTQPQLYPPLLRSARLFKRQGWDVRFYAPRWTDADELRVFSEECGADVRMLGSGGSSADKAGYLSYIAGALRCIAREKPDWVYLSDIYAAPIGTWAPKVVKKIYHEHDQYYHPTPSVWMRFLSALRGQMCRSADLVVVPNSERARILVKDSGMRADRCLCVWNCPLRSEVCAAQSVVRGGPLRIIYVGAITPDRGIETVIRALPQGAELDLVGYETPGSHGYIDHMLRLAGDLGVGAQVTWKGAVLRRAAVLELIRSSTVGICLLPKDGKNINMNHMVGASNKVFDLMAGGSLPLVSDDEDWNEALVRPGYARGCGPGDVSGARELLRWVARCPEEVFDIRERGRSKILLDWNYETTFGPVLERMCEEGRQ